MTTNHDTHVIRTRALSRGFRIPGRHDLEVTALHRIDLAVPRGGFHAIVGASGSGKSTLMHCVAGVDRPTGGEVHLLGQPTTRLRAARLAAFRARHVGFIFQEYNLISALSVAENVGLPAELSGHPLHRSEILQALDHVGLARLADRLPHRLSGGERQRVAVARVLARRPDIVFADEPTGALDPASAEVVLRWLRGLAHDGTTVLMVTHDLGAAARADEVVVMHAGRLTGRLAGGDEYAIHSLLTAARSAGVPG